MVGSGIGGRCLWVCLLPAVLLFFLPLAASADPIDWAAHGSLLFFAADNGQDSDPAPILPSVGFTATWNFWGPLRLDLTCDLYFTNYEYNVKLGYPMACNPENRSAFVMGFLTGVQLTVFIPIDSAGSDSSGRGIRFYAGPGVDLRIVALAFGLNHPGDFSGNIETDTNMQTEAIRKYFRSEGRWLYPVAGIGMDFPVNEKFFLGFDFRTWFPVYRLWTDQHLPSVDGWRFGAGIRITPRR